MIASVETYFAFGMTWPDSCRYFECKRPGKYSTVDSRVLCCGEGLHSTMQPLDALRYYRRVTEYWEVECTETTMVTRHESGRETRKVARESVARSRASLNDLVWAQIQLMLDGKAVGAQTELALVPPKTAVATGARAIALAALGGAVASGDLGVAVDLGWWWGGGTAVALGKEGLGVASGRGGVALASEPEGDAIAAGEHGVAMAAGFRGTAAAPGRDSIAVAVGVGGRARGSLGSWIVVAEHDGGRVIDVRSLRVDGEQILADTYYALRDGRVVETTEEERKS